MTRAQRRNRTVNNRISRSIPRARRCLNAVNSGNIARAHGIFDQIVLYCRNRNIGDSPMLCYLGARMDVGQLNAALDLCSRSPSTFIVDEARGYG